MKFKDILDLPIFRNPNFYFGLFGLLIVYAPRFGLVLTTQEIGQTMGFLALILGVSPPSVQWIQTKALNRRIKAMEMQGVSK